MAQSSKLTSAAASAAVADVDSPATTTTPSAGLDSRNLPSSSAPEAAAAELEPGEQPEEIPQGALGALENDDSAAFRDMRQLVLQGIMTAGCLEVKGVKKLIQFAVQQAKYPVPAADHLSPTFIQKVFVEINKKLKDLDMQIRSVTCEITGAKFYMFTTNIVRPHLILPNQFTDEEMKLFRLILKALLRNRKNFTISMIDCVNLGGNINKRSLNKSKAEDFVKKMISSKHFTKVFTNEQNKDEYEITLGCRALQELEPNLREDYPEVFADCCLCKKILLNGLQCPQCRAVVHRGCFHLYIKNCKNCMNCDGRWQKEAEMVKRTHEGVEVEEPMAVEEETAGDNPAVNGEEDDMQI